MLICRHDYDILSIRELARRILQHVGWRISICIDLLTIVIAYVRNLAEIVLAAIRMIIIGHIICQAMLFLLFVEKHGSGRCGSLVPIIVSLLFAPHTR